MEQLANIVVADFDKTLTNYDTCTAFFFSYNCKAKRFKILLAYGIKVLSKLKLVSVQSEKETLLSLFFGNSNKQFLEHCKKFHEQIELNPLGVKVSEDHSIVIVSASFTDYLKYLFPHHQLIATTLKVSATKKIEAIDQHPFADEKARLLKKKFKDGIDIFYTDSKNDLPTAKISKLTHWVKNGKVIQTSNLAKGKSSS